MPFGFLRINILKAVIFAVLALFSLSANAGQKALVIIDVQEYFVRYWGAHWRYGNPERLPILQHNQVAMIQAAKAKNLPILILEMKGDRIKYGQTQDYILEAIGDYEKVKTIQKTKDSLFHEENESRELALQTLKNWRVEELILIGANGTVCVRYTMQDALKAGFKVWTFTKGIIDMAYSDKEFTYPFEYRTWFETQAYFQQYQRMGLTEIDTIEGILPP